MGARGRIALTAGAVVVVVAAGAGLGLALTGSDDDHQSPKNTAAAAAAAAPSTGATGSSTTPSGTKAKPGKAEREAWAHQYGQDRSAAPNLADVASATPEQRAAATDLLTRVEAATATNTDVNAAKAAGFDVLGTVAKAEQRNPKLAARISRADASGAADRLPLLPVRNTAAMHDGKVLDPSAPDALLYSYQGHDVWKLVGAEFAGNKAQPQAPPDPGGPITRWTYGRRGGSTLTMRVFFVPGNDLAHAYAMTEQTS